MPEVQTPSSKRSTGTCAQKRQNTEPTKPKGVSKRSGGVALRKQPAFALRVQVDMDSPATTSSRALPDSDPQVRSKVWLTKRLTGQRDFLAPGARSPSQIDSTAGLLMSSSRGESQVKLGK